MPLKTFVIGILYNRAHEKRRQDRRFQEHDSIDDIMDKKFVSNGHWARAFLTPEEFAQAAQTLEEIQKCLDVLPLQQKAAFILKCVQEEDTKDICNILEVSGTHLGVLLFRSRNKLRECIENNRRIKLRK